MSEDLIVVDDENDTGASQVASTSQTPASGAQSMRTRRRSTATSSILNAESPLDRATRQSTRMKSQPKLKLKLSEKAASQAPGMSFLGPYDRELDSDEDDLSFEEQFILRMPPGEDCDKLRKMVAAREISNDVWFRFKDSRRAVFHVGNSTYSSKLVDLPCVIESQKTVDNKQMFKVADICQMLVVEDKIVQDDTTAQQRHFNVDEFIWPHGITPPLHHVRKRRFRKRANKRAIENVEQEVERLLQADAAATSVSFDVLENVNPDLSDSEFIERDGRGEAFDAPTPALGSEGDAPTPAYAGDGDGDGDADDDDDEEEGDGDIDEDLAAELDLALVGDDEGDDDDDEDDDDDDSDEDDEDDDDEVVQSRKLVNEEIRDLENAVARKKQEIASSVNSLIRKRFEDALKKLQADLDLKLSQRDDMKERQRLRDEGIASQDASEAELAGNGNAEDELFGSADDVEME